MAPPESSKRYRIGFLISSLEGGGAESVTLAWAENLAGRGHDVRLYTYESGSRTPPRAMKFGVTSFRGRSRVVKASGLPLWVRRRARADRLDVLVTAMTYANIAGAIGVGLRRLPGLTLMLTEHNVATLALPLDRPGHAATAKRLIARAVYGRADGAIGVSHPVAADLVAGFGLDPSRVFVLPNPITDRPAPRTEPSQRKLTVAFVGRIAEQKQPLLFVDTLAALAARGIEVRGLVIGDGPLRSAVESHARELSVQLSFVGWRVPWWSVEPRPDCVLLTSFVEGLANVLVEAAAAGIPVVARSNALGTADAVIPGVTGELALGESPERLADAVIRAAARPGAASDPIEPWLSHFSVENSTSLLLEAIEISNERRS